MIPALEDCFYFGICTKAHGLKGTLKVLLDSDYAQEILQTHQGQTIYLLPPNGKRLRPYTLEGFGPFGNDPDTWLLELAEITDRNGAESLRNFEIFLPLSALPETDPEAGTFYYHEIINFKAVDARLGYLGTVIGVEEFPAQDLLVVLPDPEKYPKTIQHFLIPITDDFVPAAHPETKTVDLNCPEGLIETYLASENEKSKEEDSQ